MTPTTILRLPLAAIGLCLSLIIGSASAQDPAVVNATTIQVRFENNRVRVLEATLPAGVKEKVHSHPAYLFYVIAGGKIRNYNADGKVTEAVLKTGDVIYREPLTHAAENIGGAPIHLLLVELKGPG